MSTSTGPGRPERAITKASRIVRAMWRDVGHERVVLGDRQRDAGDVDLLEGVACRATFEETWPVMKTVGEESSIAVAMPVVRFVAPGPEVAIATPTLPARARVAVGHVGGALLVAHEDVADRVVEHGVVGGQDRAAGVAEDGAPPLPSPGIPRRSVRPFVALAPPREAQKAKPPRSSSGVRVWPRLAYRPRSRTPRAGCPAEAGPAATVVRRRSRGRRRGLRVRAS